MSSSSGASKKKPATHFEQFVAKKKRALVADTNGASRAAIAGILAKLGLHGQVTLVEDFGQAEKRMEELTPSLVIADFDLGTGTGLDLFRGQREKNPFFRESLFLLVTGNPEQSSAARAAEEEVDVFLMKPFTTDAFVSALQNGLQAKQEPSEYQRLIERGKDQLDQGDVDGALRTFHQAKSSNALPSLACAYLGKAYQQKGDLELAEGSYVQGLEYNAFHFRCLTGLYEVLSKQQRHEEAYVPLFKRLKKFPWSPAELAAGVRLAVHTRNFDDLDQFYAFFTHAARRDEELSRVLGAAFLTCGKFFVQKKELKKALPALQKAAILAGGKTSVLKEIVVVLGEAGYGDKTDEFISRFPPATQKEADFGVASFIRFDATASPGKSIEKGRELFARGIHDPAVYWAMIRRAKEANQVQLVDQLAHEGARRFPEQKAQFHAFLAHPK